MTFIDYNCFFLGFTSLSERICFPVNFDINLKNLLFKPLPDKFLRSKSSISSLDTAFTGKPTAFLVQISPIVVEAVFTALAPSRLEL